MEFHSDTFGISSKHKKRANSACFQLTFVGGGRG